MEIRATVKRRRKDPGKLEQPTDPSHHQWRAMSEKSDEGRRQTTKMMKGLKNDEQRREHLLKTIDEQRSEQWLKTIDDLLMQLERIRPKSKDQTKKTKRRQPRKHHVKHEK